MGLLIDSLAMGDLYFIGLLTDYLAMGDLYFIGLTVIFFMGLLFLTGLLTRILA